MDIRRAYIRRSVKQARLQKRLGVAAMFAVSCCLAVLLRPQAQPGAEMATLATDGPLSVPPAVLRVGAAPDRAPARRIYAYSIVPGGVASRADLAQAVLADKAVAAHYAGFAVHKASLHTVAKARPVYVSYRKGDQVYWTARPVTLAEGEAVLSDGESEIRARCGNRISETPRLPVEAKGPSEQELDTALEQAEDGGTLLQATSALVDEGRDGQPFRLQVFPNGAGLLAGAAPASGLERAGFAGSLPELAARPLDGNGAILLASLSGTPPLQGGSDPARPALDGVGGKPAGPDTSNPPNPQNPPKAPKEPAANPPADPAAKLPPSSKPRELPEPGTLWLTSVAAVLLLHRRRRPGRSR